jgi:hypothetical protein
MGSAEEVASLGHPDRQMNAADRDRVHEFGQRVNRRLELRETRLCLHQHIIDMLQHLGDGVFGELLTNQVEASHRYFPTFAAVGAPGAGLSAKFTVVAALFCTLVGSVEIS